MRARRARKAEKSDFESVLSFSSVASVPKKFNRFSRSHSTELSLVLWSHSLKCPWLRLSLIPTHRSPTTSHECEHKERKNISFNKKMLIKSSDSFQKLLRFGNFTISFSGEPWNTPHASLRPGAWTELMQKFTNCRELRTAKTDLHNRATWVTLYVWIAPNDITNWSAVETAERQKSDGYENENEKVKWEDAKRVHQREI